jgi:hypothetical protein
MVKQSHKIIGHIAFDSQNKIVLTNDKATIVAETGDVLSAYISINFPHLTSQVKTKKITYGQIHNLLEKGKRYAFTKESYERFYPIGVENNLNLPYATAEQWEQQYKLGLHLITVQIANTNS